jgi:hypothetical protein
MTILALGWFPFRSESPVALPAPPSSNEPNDPKPLGGGVHLYLRVAGEPEDRAIALDLTSKGDRP